MFKKILFCLITGIFVLALSVLPAFAYSPPPADVNEDISDGLAFYQASGIALYETVDEMSDIDNRPIFRVVYLGTTYVYSNASNSVLTFEETYLGFGAQTYYATDSDGTIITARYIEVTNEFNQTLMWYNSATELFTFVGSPSSNGDVVYFAYNPEFMNVLQDVYARYFGFIDYSGWYDLGYDAGYEYGYDAGYDLGDTEGYDIGYDEGYRIGFSAGQLSSYEGFTIKDLMNAVVSSPVNMVRSMLNVEVLGYNLSGVFFGLITLCILITVVVIIFKVAK